MPSTSKTSQASGSSFVTSTSRLSTKDTYGGNDDGRLSEDELFEQLEAELDDMDGPDGFMAGYREQRLEQMKREVNRIQALKEDDHGKLIEIKVEKDAIQSAAKAKRTVMHFYHPDFRRCQLMDKHLTTLAAKHLRTKFIKVDVANVPFLVVKLDVKVLPCVISFIDGVAKDKIVGFDDLGDGNGDNFTTAQLELRMSQSGVIEPQKREGSMLAAVIYVNLAVHRFFQQLRASQRN